MDEDASRLGSPRCGSDSGELRGSVKRPDYDMIMERRMLGICGPAVPWLRRGHAEAAGARDALRRICSSFRVGVQESGARSLDHLSQQRAICPCRGGPSGEQSSILRVRSPGWLSGEQGSILTAGPGFGGHESSRFLWRKRWKKPDSEINDAEQLFESQALRRCSAWGSRVSQSNANVPSHLLHSSGPSLHVRSASHPIECGSDIRGYMQPSVALVRRVVPTGPRSLTSPCSVVRLRTLIYLG